METGRKFNIGPMGKHIEAEFLATISVSNLLKLHGYVTWHVPKWHLSLEFWKWYPLPWKYQKFQKFQNAPKLKKLYNNVYKHL